MDANKLSRPLTLIILVACAFVMSFFLYRNTEIFSGSAERTHAGVELLPEEGAETGQGDSASKAPSVTADEVFEAYSCDNLGAVECANNPLVAKSPEEAQWLQRHGYPTVAQLLESKNLSADQWRTRSTQTGTPIDKSLYGVALAREGDFSEAKGVLGTSVINDKNLYALYPLADIYLQDAKFRNPPLSAAYLRLAYLAGDNKASAALAARFPKMIQPEMISADQRAAELHESMLRNQKWARP